MENSYYDDTPSIGWKAPLGLTELQQLRDTVDLYLRERNLEYDCNVHISRSGKWYVMTGVVDSPWTKAALFSLVPAKRHGRKVIDKLKIAYRPLHDSFAS